MLFMLKNINDLFDNRVFLLFFSSSSSRGGVQRTQKLISSLMEYQSYRRFPFLKGCVLEVMRKTLNEVFLCSWFCRYILFVVDPLAFVLCASGSR